jgi:hypothetical protein
VVTLTGTEPHKAAKPDRRSNPGAGRSCQTMMHRYKRLGITLFAYSRHSSSRCRQRDRYLGFIGFLKAVEH